MPINFPKKYKSKIYQVGNHFARKKLLIIQFSKRKITKKNFSILVLGGSQGAEVFGRIVPLSN